MNIWISATRHHGIRLAIGWLACFAMAMAASSAQAVAFIDEVLRIGLEVPQGTSAQRTSNERGKAIDLTFPNSVRQELIRLQVVRANNGGFGAPLSDVALNMLGGIGRSLGKETSVIPRTLIWRNEKAFVVSHGAVGDGKAKTMTSLLFLLEYDGWRKVVTLQFLTKGALSDDEIRARLAEMRFEANLPEVPPVAGAAGATPAASAVPAASAPGPGTGQNK